MQTQYFNYNCAFCNPTIFNPVFNKQCVYCVHRKKLSQRITNPIAANVNPVPNFRTVMDAIKEDKKGGLILPLLNPYKLSKLEGLKIIFLFEIELFFFSLILL